MATANSPVLFRYGTSSNFPASPDPNTLYFCTDTREIYLGSTRYAFGTDTTITVEGSGDDVVNATYASATKTLTLTKGNAGTLQSVIDAIDTALAAYVQSVSAASGSAITVDNTDTQNPVVGLNLATGASAGNVTLSQSANGLKADVTIPAATVTGVKSGEQVISLDGTLLQSTLTLAYDSTNKRIQLKGIGGAVVTDLDATAFVKDGMIDTVTLEDGTGPDAGKIFLVITFNTDAGKQTIKLDVSELIDVYTAAAGGGLVLNDHAFSIDNTVTAGTAVRAATLAFGQATAVTVAAYDTHGLVTGTQTVNITLPSLPSAVTGSVGASNNTKVVTYANLTSSSFSGNALDITDTAPSSQPTTEIIPSTKALWDGMTKWGTFGS